MEVKEGDLRSDEIRRVATRRVRRKGEGTEQSRGETVKTQRSGEDEGRRRPAEKEGGRGNRVLGWGLGGGRRAGSVAD